MVIPILDPVPAAMVVLALFAAVKWAKFRRRPATRGEVVQLRRTLGEHEERLRQMEEEQRRRRAA